VKGGRKHCLISILDKAMPFLVIFTGAILGFSKNYGGAGGVYGGGGRICPKLLV